MHPRQIRALWKKPFQRTALEALLTNKHTVSSSAQIPDISPHVHAVGCIQTHRAKKVNRLHCPTSNHTPPLPSSASGHRSSGGSKQRSCCWAGSRRFDTNNLQIRSARRIQGCACVSAVCAVERSRSWLAPVLTAAASAESSCTASSAEEEERE